MLSDVKAAVQHNADERNIAVNLTISESLAAVTAGSRYKCVGDPKRLQQVRGRSRIKLTTSWLP